MFPQRSKKHFKSDTVTAWEKKKSQVSTFHLFIYFFDCLSHQVVLTLFRAKAG